MSDLNLGDGHSVKRHHLPHTMAREFDEASSLMARTQARIRAWVRPLHALQAPVSASGSTSCNGVGLTGRTYELTEPGGALLVDERDVGVFTKLGFTVVPSGTAPTTGLRPGLVFFDSSVNEYLRYDGANWAQTTLS